MGKRILRGATRAAQAHVREVGPVRPEDAQGLVAQVYAQLERDFGMLPPPITLHSPAPDLLAASWALLRESLVATGATGRVAKEAVAAAVSAANACPYCVQVHTAMLHGLHGSDAHAVGEHRLDAITDPLLAECARWGRAGAHRDEAGRVPLPGTAAQAPELIGTVVTFHHLNRMVNLFLVDVPLPARVPAVARRAALGVAGKVVAPLARRVTRAGESLALLDEAPLPADLGWAAGTPAVAGAFARAAAAFERGGERSVPASVRDLVTARLAGWDGRPPPLTSAWVDEAVAELPAWDRGIGRLALLTALASYRVDRAVVAGARAAGAGDRALIEITGWASFAAARTAGSWLVAGWAALGDRSGSGPTGPAARAA